MAKAEETVTMTKDELAKLVAQIKAEVKAEVAEEMNAEESGQDERDKELFERVRKMEEHLNEPVTIQLFKDGNKYKDDVFVGWNDRNFLIQRGVPVTVPRGVAQILQESQAQDIRAQEYQERQQREFKEASIRLNI